jgi:hypothetical protein
MATWRIFLILVGIQFKKRAWGWHEVDDINFICAQIQSLTEEHTITSTIGFS